MRDLGFVAVIVVILAVVFTLDHFIMRGERLERRLERERLEQEAADRLERFPLGTVLEHDDE